MRTGLVDAAGPGEGRGWSNAVMRKAQLGGAGRVAGEVNLGDAAPALCLDAGGVAEEAIPGARGGGDAEVVVYVSTRSPALNVWQKQFSMMTVRR